VEGDAPLALATVAENPERKKLFGFKARSRGSEVLDRPSGFPTTDRLKSAATPQQDPLGRAKNLAGGSACRRPGCPIAA